MKTTKRSLTILLFALLLFCTSILILSANSLTTHGETRIEIDTSNEGAENKKCDVNKDYYVTISDVTHQLNHLSTLQDSSDESEDSELEDVDGDGNVTIADVTAILTRLAIAQNTQVYSSGLEYTLTVDKDRYFVTGMGTCTDEKVVIPPTYYGLPVASIGQRAFMHQTTITEIIIPNSITCISDLAFEYCTGLISVVIPQNVTSMGDDVFFLAFDVHQDIAPGEYYIEPAIFFEASSPNANWSMYWDVACEATVYWGGQWAYVDGVPTPTA